MAAGYLKHDAETDRGVDLPLQLRWMVRPDLEQVVDIEQASFDDPWSPSEFLAVCRRRNVIGHVALRGHTVRGFCVYEFWKKHITIINLAVDPDWRRRGIGRQMIEKLIGKLSPVRRNKIAINVRESNLGAQMFFKAMGFRATASLRGFYHGGEDGITFHYVPEVADVHKPG